MNTQTAKGFVEINQSKFGGEMYKDYYRNKPALERIKLKDFATEFAAVYNNAE